MAARTSSSATRRSIRAELLPAAARRGARRLSRGTSSAAPWAGRSSAARCSTWSRSKDCGRTASPRPRLTVPTALERQGDFSQTFAANGQVVRIFNPFSTRANPAGGFIRDQFADNRIPSALWDPVALNMLKYYPLPNQPGEPVTGRNNYVRERHGELEHEQHRSPRGPQLRRRPAAASRATRTAWWRPFRCRRFPTTWRSPRGA